MFLCFDVEVLFLTYETTTTMPFKLTADQTMTAYLGHSITLNPGKTTRVKDISQKWEKWFHTCVSLIAYILCSDQ